MPLDIGTLLTCQLSGTAMRGYAAVRTALVDAVGPVLLIGLSEVGHGCRVKIYFVARQLRRHDRNRGPRPGWPRLRPAISSPEHGNSTLSTSLPQVGLFRGTVFVIRSGSGVTGRAPSSLWRSPRSPPAIRPPAPSRPEQRLCHSGR
jgi:hypothetical protein